MDTVFVKPSEGGRVRQPERASRVMPDSGALVPRNNFYERLLLTGDVVETDPPKVEEAKPEEAKPEETKVEDVKPDEIETEAMPAPPPDPDTHHA